jgi:hypothetical protein
MDEEEMKQYKKYVAHKKQDYIRIQGFLDAIEHNGLDLPKLQYIKHIRNMLEIMEHDDKELIETKPKPKKLNKGFD